jgi:hypothetical protein
MHKLTLALAVFGSAFSAVAQNCNGAPALQTFSNRADFGASFYYNCGAHLFDLNAQVPITISGATTWLYDQGVGNPVVPNQVGNTAQVDVYTCPTTRIGSETLNPANPGSPWTLLGSGTITVVNTGTGNGESPTVFTPPLTLPAGAYGVCFVYNAPTAGTNPGPLHCLGVNPNPGVPVSDAFVTMSADSIVGTAWSGPGTDSPNLRLRYTPSPLSAQHVEFGEGCYFRPYAFYESFPASVNTPDLANTSISLVNLGPNYLAVPGALSFVTPTGTNLASGPTGSSSSANWDDALSLPITLPFTLNYPSGSTNDITISSNGAVLLASVVNNSYDVCGASYGSIIPFRDGPPRIAGYHHDLDPTVGGGIYYEVDPSNTFVRITWDSVQEWGVAAAVNTIQMTIHNSGNVDIYYGVLGNRSNGNNAIAGFTPGLGSRVPAAQDISATLPFQSGDGAIPPVLTMSARAVFGTTPNIVTKNITPGTAFQFLITSLGSVPAADLSVYGMPGCNRYVDLFPGVYVSAILTGIGGNGEFAVPFAIPNDPSYQNVQFRFQSAPLTSGLNAANIITSNGLCVKIGL